MHELWGVSTTTTRLVRPGELALGFQPDCTSMVCNISLSQRDKGRQAGNGARQRTATAIDCDCFADVAHAAMPSTGDGFHYYRLPVAAYSASSTDGVQHSGNLIMCAERRCAAITLLPCLRAHMDGIDTTSISRNDIIHRSFPSPRRSRRASNAHFSTDKSHASKQNDSRYGRYRLLWQYVCADDVGQIRPQEDHHFFP